MSIVEIVRGPINHRYLMGKSKDQLATMYMQALSVIDKCARNADRYQLVRRGQHWSVIDGIGNTLRGDDLDAAADRILDGAATGDSSHG